MEAEELGRHSLPGGQNKTAALCCLLKIAERKKFANPNPTEYPATTIPTKVSLCCMYLPPFSPVQEFIPAQFYIHRNEYLKKF